MDETRGSVAKPTAFLAKCSRDALNANVDKHRNMFVSLTRAGAVDELPDSGKVNANITEWSHDMKGHAKKCVERHCELANKNIEQLCKASTPCIDDHQFKKEELETAGDVSKLGADRPEVPVLGTHRQTRHCVVCEQTCSSSHEMDQSL